MQVHSIISNTISEEVLQSGHLSIRFRTDGFSLLLEDSNYKPVILNHFSREPHLSLAGHIQACEEWLNTHTLLDQFKGETTIVVESQAATLVPKKLFAKEHQSYYLEQTNAIAANETVRRRKIKNRPFVLLFAVNKLIMEFAEGFRSKVRITHPAECLLSAADQVDASVHQRGFLLIETQEHMLEILAIQNDDLLLSNRYKIKNQDEIIYHTINTLKQLDLDLKNIPVYLSGRHKPGHETMLLLGKYIKKVEALPYFIHDIDKDAIQANIILAEASKCE